MLNALWSIQDELRRLWKYEELNEDEWKIVDGDDCHYNLTKGKIKCGT